MRGDRRPGDRGAAGADLSDDGLCLPRRRPRRAPVQPAGGRIHLFAPDQPDRCGSASARRGAGGRRGGGLLFVGARGPDTGAVPADGTGAQHRRLDPALWRHGDPVQPHDPAVRMVGEVRRLRRPRGAARGDRRRHARGLLRIDQQSRRVGHRHPGGRGHCGCGGDPADRRQHAGHPLSVPPDRDGRDAGRAQPDEIHDRQRHGDRRRGRGQRHLRLVRQRQVSQPVGPGTRLSRAEVPRDLRQHGLHLPRHRHRAARSGHDHEPAGRRITR